MLIKCNSGCSEFPAADNCLIVPASGSFNLNAVNESTTAVYTSGSGICGDHGHCVQQSDGDFKCACDLGYAGKYCLESEYLPLHCVFSYPDVGIEHLSFLFA